MLHRASSVALALILLISPVLAETDVAATATTFVEQFFKGNLESYAGLMADDLKAA